MQYFVLFHPRHTIILQVFDEKANFLRTIGESKPHNPLAKDVELHQPVGVACDSHGLIYVSQMKPACIKVSPLFYSNVFHAARTSEATMFE